MLCFFLSNKRKIKIKSLFQILILLVFFLIQNFSFSTLSFYIKIWGLHLKWTKFTKSSRKRMNKLKSENKVRIWPDFLILLWETRFPWIKNKIVMFSKIFSREWLWKIIAKKNVILCAQISKLVAFWKIKVLFGDNIKSFHPNSSLSGDVFFPKFNLFSRRHFYHFSKLFLFPNETTVSKVDWISNINYEN